MATSMQAKDCPVGMLFRFANDRTIYSAGYIEYVKGVKMWSYRHTYYDKEDEGLDDDTNRPKMYCKPETMIYLIQKGSLGSLHNQ